MSSSAAASTADWSDGFRVMAKRSRSSSHSRTFRSRQSCGPGAATVFAACPDNVDALYVDALYIVARGKGLVAKVDMRCAVRNMVGIGATRSQAN